MMFSRFNPKDGTKICYGGFELFLKAKRLYLLTGMKFSRQKNTALPIKIVENPCFKPIPKSIRIVATKNTKKNNFWHVEF